MNKCVSSLLLRVLHLCFEISYNKIDKKPFLELVPQEEKDQFVVLRCIAHK